MIDKKKYQRTAAFYPLIAAVLLSVGWVVMDNLDYRSEWTTAQQWMLIEGIMSVLLSLLISVACSTVVYAVEKSGSGPMRAYFWFGPGMIAMAAVVWFVYGSAGLIYPTLICLPFLLGLVISYRQFLVDLASPE